MRQPTIYLARNIRRWACDRNHPALGWIPARPCGHNLFGLMQRWKTAFMVLIGKYDALDWEDNYCERCHRWLAYCRCGLREKLNET